MSPTADPVTAKAGRLLRYILGACLLGLLLLTGSGCGREEPSAPQYVAPTPVPVPTPTENPYAAGFDLGGSHYAIDLQQLDLSGISDPADVETFCRVAPYMDRLTRVILGDESISPVSWSVIRQMQEAAPNVQFHYRFTLYGQPMALDMSTIDLRKVRISDNGAAVMEVLPYMKQCTYLDMDQSGVDDAHMAYIRDSFPNIKVVWRVWFGTMDYSARTDVKTVLASLSGGSGPRDGLTDEESCLPLTYCTDMVNLDLGHNSNLRTLYFLRYMPDLEVFITYENYLRDIDDLVYCQKLRYLELFGSSMTSISAIAELPELTDLQLGGCYNLNDISPIIPADKVSKLTRLWLTPGCISQSQIDAFKQNHPKCTVNDTDNSVGYYWRFKDPIHEGNSRENRTPQYQAIVDIFHYGASDLKNYNFSANDPYYTTPQGKPVTGDQRKWFYGR